MRRWWWIGVVCGCGPVVDVGEEGAEATSSASTSVGTSTSTATTTSTTATTTTTTTATTTSTSDVTGDPPSSGVCVAGCEVAMDCCLAYAGDQDCMGQFGTYPWNFTCAAGVCEFGGCTSDEDCTFGGVLEGFSCIAMGDTAYCQPGCATDEDCESLVPGWRCDNGVYCTPQPCTDDASCGPGLLCHPETGQCFDGCDGDDECNGFGVCDPGTGTCVCTDSEQCMDGYRCAPA